MTQCAGSVTGSKQYDDRHRRTAITALAMPGGWIGECIGSVHEWARASGFGYIRLGDELFDFAPPGLRDRTATQTVVATDLARLRAAQALLADGYETVVWCDADFLGPVYLSSATRMAETLFASGHVIARLCSSATPRSLCLAGPQTGTQQWRR
tara:strand:+ start:6664 stop:7125 length:462 start_codon:yes stop_codon:yes gene_type:complete